MIGILIIIFVLVEFSTRFAALEIPAKYLPWGGALSGFFGGLSGHQGAFRSMFLLRAGLTKEQFIATGVMLAILVDIARIAFYSWDQSDVNRIDWCLVLAATLAAFVGVFAGARLLKKVTIQSIQKWMSLLLTRTRDKKCR